MRGSRNPELMLGKDGDIAAISLGADFVSEHEWGINQTYRTFGIDSEKIGKDPVGIESRVIRRVTDTLSLTKHNKRKRPGNHSVGWKGTLLYLASSSYRLEDPVDPAELRELYDSPGRDDDMEPLSTAWSDGDFAIFARKERDQQFLEDLHVAMQNDDCAIWLGGGGAFENAGLCFGIVSRMSDDIIQSFAEADNAQTKLETADAATGIKDRLKAASDAAGGDTWNRPYRYYALSPKMKDDHFSNKDTAYDVVYWLNPMDQDNVNFGWFTVEELDRWIEGKGPVPGGRNAKKSA